MSSKYMVCMSWDPQDKYSDWNTKMELYQLRKKYNLKLAAMSMMKYKHDKTQYGVYFPKKFYHTQHKIETKLKGYAFDAEKILNDKGLKGVLVEVVNRLD